MSDSAVFSDARQFDLPGVDIDRPVKLSTPSCRAACRPTAGEQDDYEPKIPVLMPSLTPNVSVRCFIRFFSAVGTSASFR